MIKGQKVKENNMSNYVISCCSTADLTREHMLERNIKYACFHYELDGKEYMDDLGQSMPLPDFYKAMEAGAMTKTSQINQEEYMEYFRQFLDEGYDVLHCTLSSGISGTVNSARLAKEALEEEYPDRKIYVIDSLAASSGFGLLMDKLADLRDSGMDIDTLADWTMEHRLEVNHWFFSSDLTFFIRGGRISKTAGFVGNVLNICPFMNVSNEGKLIVREMTDLLVLDLVDKRLVTDQIVLTIGYDITNLSNKADSCFGNNYDHAVNNKGRDSIGGKKGTHRDYTGEITIDRYGRKVPKHAHGTANLGRYTSSTRIIMDAVMELYDRIIDPSLLTRRITVVANRVCDESKVQESEQFEQLDLFTDYQARAKEKQKEDEALSKERKLQEAIISVKKKYGKNAMLKGMNLEEGATTISRNNQIGGHKA